MTKYLTYIAFLTILLSFKSSDKLNGKYFSHCSNNKTEYYEFRPNGEFDYFASCEFKIYGHGKYQLIKEKLLLEYLPFRSKEKGHFEIWGYKIANEYSDTIRIGIQNSQSNEKIDNVTIHYTDTQTGTSNLRNEEIKIVRLNKDLIVSSLGYHDLIIPKDLIINKGILGFNVLLQNRQINFIENITDTIELRNCGHDSLMIDNCLFVKNIKSNKIIICE